MKTYRIHSVIDLISWINEIKIVAEISRNNDFVNYCFEVSIESQNIDKFIQLCNDNADITKFYELSVHNVYFNKINEK